MTFPARALLLASLGLWLQLGVARAGQVYVDDFTRADTPTASVIAPDGVPYDLRGPFERRYPLGPARSGRIEGGRFVADRGTVVYAFRRFADPVRRVEADVRFDRSTGWRAGSSAALIVTRSRWLLDQMLHVVVNRSEARLEKRFAGTRSFVVLGRRKFASLLPLGVPVKIRLELERDVALLKVGSELIEARDADIRRVVGPTVGWEIYQPARDASEIVSYDRVLVLSGR